MALTLTLICVVQGVSDGRVDAFHFVQSAALYAADCATLHFHVLSESGDSVARLPAVSGTQQPPPSPLQPALAKSGLQRFSLSMNSYVSGSCVCRFTDRYVHAHAGEVFRRTDSNHDHYVCVGPGPLCLFCLLVLFVRFVLTPHFSLALSVLCCAGLWCGVVWCVVLRACAQFDFYEYSRYTLGLSEYASHNTSDFRRRLTLVFDQLDLNSDGYVSAAEFDWGVRSALAPARRQFGLSALVVALVVLGQVGLFWLWRSRLKRHHLELVARDPFFLDS
jgi:hypothetical protein